MWICELVVILEKAFFFEKYVNKAKTYLNLEVSEWIKLPGPRVVFTNLRLSFGSLSFNFDDAKSKYILITSRDWITTKCS